MLKSYTPEELASMLGEKTQTGQPSLKSYSPEEIGQLLIDSAPSAEQREDATFGDYLRAVPSTAFDVSLGAAEGFASAIGSFTGNYNLARDIAEARTDINDAIYGDAPEELKSDFAYKVSSGLGSTLPYLAAALLSRKPSLLTKAGVGAFFLSSAGQQVRDDYLASEGVTSENATDEQMKESTKLGAVGAIPIALSERLGAGAILRPFVGKAIPAGKVMDRIKQYASAGAGEALTEATQSGLINSIAKFVGQYDKDRPITQGMVESAIIGAIVGGGVNMGVDAVSTAVTQNDRLKAGVESGEINAKDVIDPEIGSKLTEVALDNGSIPPPERETLQEAKIRDKTGLTNLASRALTPLSRRLGRAGKEVKRAFRRYELQTGRKINEAKTEAQPFMEKMEKLRKTNKEDYDKIQLALANSNELAADLPESQKQKLQQQAATNPSVLRSDAEQILDSTNPFAQQINQQIEQARNALAERGLGTSIIVVPEGSSFYDPQQNLIGISASEADGSTVAHEFFHAALGQAVKTDVELQNMTRNMFDSVIRATVDGSALNNQLKGFVSQYDQNIQNEEFLAQAVGELAAQYETLDINTKTRIKIWINDVMNVLGLSSVFKQAETDAEVIEQLNAFARFSGSAEGLTESTAIKQANQFDTEEITPLGTPVNGTKFQRLKLEEIPDNTFPSKPNSLSLITEKNKVDIEPIMDDVVKNNKKVAFFAADQLGVGKKGNYVLDGGPSFALTKDGVFWMSGSKDKVDQSTTMKQYADADYIFVFSGSPTMHTFNKSVFNGLVKTIESKYKSYDGFKDAFMKAAMDSADSAGNPVGGVETANIINFLDANDSFEQFRDEGNQSPKVKNAVPRKDLVKLIDKLSNAKKDSALRDLALGLKLDLDSLRDGFYVKNDYGWLDLMMIGKPNGNVVKGDFHSTYADQFMGETLGVPNKKVNLSDLLSKEEYDKIVEKYVEVKRNSLLKRKNKNLTEEATQDRLNKSIEKLSKQKKFLNDPDGLRAEANRIESDYIANLEYTQAREDADYALASEPQTSIADKINYNAGGMKMYTGKQLRNFEEMKDLQNTSPKQIIDSLNRAEREVRKQKIGGRKIGEGELMARLDSVERTPRVKGSDRFKKWFGKGELVHPDGTPMVFFHGTKTEDIKAFDPKFTQGLVGEHGWLFFSSDPDLSIRMAAQQEASDVFPPRKSVLEQFEDDFFKDMDKADEALFNYAKDIEASLREDAKESGESTEDADLLALAIKNKNVDAIQKVAGIDYSDALNQEVSRKFGGVSAQKLGLYSDVNVIPVYLNAKNIFNPTNELMVDELIAHMREKYPNEIKKSASLGYEIDIKSRLLNGAWRNYENATAAKSLRELGYDGIALKEDKEFSTIAVWNPTMDKSKYRTTPYVKSVFNKGTWQLTSSQIKEQKQRKATASEQEIIRGISDEGMALLQKHGLTEDYNRVRNLLDRLAKEYSDLGLDMSYINQYFPRSVSDLKGLRQSFGITGSAIDQEIERYEKVQGKQLSDVERQMMYEKLARSRLYRGGLGSPKNLKERRKVLVTENELQYYDDAVVALNNYLDQMVNSIETKKFIGDGASGSKAGVEPVSGELGKVMDTLRQQGRLRLDQIEVIQEAVQARFGQKARQYGAVKATKNLGYLATMGNIGSTLTQLGDFYFVAVQNGVIPTIEAVMGKKNFKLEDMGLAKDMVSIENKDGAGMFAKSVDRVFKLTGLTALDRLAKESNINAAYKTLTAGAKANQESNKYKKTLNRLKMVQGNDAYKTIADLQNGVKSDLVIEAIYNQLADVAPISLTEMPQTYINSPNGRIFYSLKSYTIKQFNFLRERTYEKMAQSVVDKDPKMFAEASSDMMKILVFATAANGTADILKAIVFNREIDEEEFFWNHVLRMFGVTKYTTTRAREEGVGTALAKTALPPQFSILDDITRDTINVINNETDDGFRSTKYIPLVGKLYYWRDGRGVDVEERLSRLREKD